MSLKHIYADEIAAAMASTLENEDFIGQFKKEAAGSHEETLREAIEGGNKEHCTLVYNTYFSGGEGDTALQAELSEKYGDDKAMEVTHELRSSLYKVCNPGPGSAFPAAADDDSDGCSAEDDCAECGDLDRETGIALAFAMDNLVKVANALDNRGFSTMANIIDEAVEKLAAKKK